MSMNQSIGSAIPTTRKIYIATFNGVNLGLCDTIDPSKFKMNFDPIMTGSTGGKNKIGDRFVGVEGVVTVELRQVNVAKYRALAPWSNGSSGAIALTPPLNADMYQYAAPLTLHPQENGPSDTSEDVDFVAACPITLPLLKRDGKEDDKLSIDFAIYPSRTAITADPTNLAPGTIGPAGS